MAGKMKKMKEKYRCAEGEKESKKERNKKWEVCEKVWKVWHEQTFIYFRGHT
jgi:hypothetical protein